MEILIGIVLGILALLGLKKFEPKSKLPPSIDDDKVEELETELERLDRISKKMNEGKMHELTNEEIQDYWMQNDE